MESLFRRKTEARKHRVIIMADNVEIIIDLDNTEAVKRALAEQVETILEACGDAAEGYAVANIRRNDSIITSNLVNSITHEVEGNTMTVGTAVEYAPYVELGTGKYTENSGAKKIPWTYYDKALERFVTTYGQPPKPFLKPAMEDHKDDYIKYIKDKLTNG